MPRVADDPPRRLPSALATATGPARSSACPPTSAVAPAAWASAATQAAAAGGPNVAGQHFERQGQQSVAHQNGRRFAEDLVACRPAATQVVVVHRRQIVVDQRIGVDHFHGAGRRQGRARSVPPQASADHNTSIGRSRLPGASRLVANRFAQHGRGSRRRIACSDRARRRSGCRDSARAYRSSGEAGCGPWLTAGTIS